MKKRRVSVAIVSIFSSENKDLTIGIIGIFSFTEQHEFMQIYANKDVESCTLNMRSTSNSSSVK